MSAVGAIAFPLGGTRADAAIRVTSLTCDAAQPSERYTIAYISHPPIHEILIKPIERYQVGFIWASLHFDYRSSSCISSMAGPPEAENHFSPAAHYISITGSQFIEVIVFQYCPFVASQ